MAKIKKIIKSCETKREKFIRLAESRMDNTLKNIELLSNLANTSNYEYTQADIDKMIKALKCAVSDLEKNFSHSSNTNKKFKL